MTAPRAFLFLLLLVLLVSACSGPVPGTAQPAPAATTGPSTGPPPAPSRRDGAPPIDGDGVVIDEEAAVEDAFERYSTAVLDRDFATACELNSPESAAKVIDEAEARGLTADTCEEAFAAVFATPGTADAAEEILRNTEVEDVTVSGDTATVEWSTEAAGERRDGTTGMRRTGGTWQLTD